jgi:site-specific recombinase XerD
MEHKGSPAGFSDTSEEWKLLEEKTREALRLRQRSYNTEKTYIIWLRNLRAFVSGKHPKDLAGKDLQDFLTHLAVEKKVSPSTQNQALNAIVFFYRHVLEKDIKNELSAVRTKQRRRLPVVLTEREVRQVFEELSGGLPTDGYAHLRLRTPAPRMPEPTNKRHRFRTEYGHCESRQR